MTKEDKKDFEERLKAILNVKNSILVFCNMIDEQVDYLKRRLNDQDKIISLPQSTQQNRKVI